MMLSSAKILFVLLLVVCFRSTATASLSKIDVSDSKDTTVSTRSSSNLPTTSSRLGRSLISAHDFDSMVRGRRPFRTLQESSSSLPPCSDTCTGNVNVYYGSCPPLSTRNYVNNNWCVADESISRGSIQGSEVCCDDDASDCCQLTAGGYAVTITILIAIIAGITICSCACCSCCPLYSKLCCAPRGQPSAVGGGGGVVGPSAAAAPMVNTGSYATAVPATTATDYATIVPATTATAVPTPDAKVYSVTGVEMMSSSTSGKS